MTAQLLAAIAAVAIPAGFIGYAVGHYLVWRGYRGRVRDLENEVALLGIQMRVARRPVRLRGRRAA